MRCETCPSFQRPKDLWKEEQGALCRQCSRRSNGKDTSVNCVRLLSSKQQDLPPPHCRFASPLIPRSREGSLRQGGLEERPKPLRRVRIDLGSKHRARSCEPTAQISTSKPTDRFQKGREPWDCFFELFDRFRTRIQSQTWRIRNVPHRASHENLNLRRNIVQFLMGGIES